MRSAIFAFICFTFLPAIAWGGESVYKDNIVVVLDASGSMDSKMADSKGNSVQKLEAAKLALLEVVKTIPPTTNIGLLVFSGAGYRNEWVYPLGPKDEAKLAAAIKQPRPGDGTPLGAYIKKGADRLLEEREKQMGYGTYRLLVVTDGEATDGNLYQIYTPEVLARGITLDVIGVDMKQDHALAKMSHSYRRANNPESFAKAIQEVFAEVGSAKEDAAGEDAFSMLEPIPSELAKATIQALSTTGNHPIGEKPKPKPNPVSGAQTPGQAQAPAAGEGMSAGTIILLVFFAIIAIVVVIAVIKKASEDY